MWLWVIAIKLPTALLGFVMVPLLYRYRNTQYKDIPFWTKPWANFEDWLGQSPDGNDVGSLPRWWIKREGDDFKAWYRYHAIRNPANGLRSFSWISAKITPHKVRYKTNHYMERYDVSKMREQNIKTVWYVAWVDWKMGLEVIHLWSGGEKRHFNIKLGWRIEPNDIHGDPTKLGMTHASFASKVLPFREG
jgi:hypothetical protein